MTEAINGAPAKPKGLITFEEWCKIMRRIHNIIDKQLTYFERQIELSGPNGEGRLKDGKPFDPVDIQRFGALSRTLANTRVLNTDIKVEQLNEDQKQQLLESRAKHEELQCRLARLTEHGKDE